MPPLLRYLAFGFCGIAGYVATAAFTAKPSGQLPASAATPTAAAVLPAAPLTPDPDGALRAEWEEMRTRFGSGSAELPALYAAVKDIKDTFRRRAFRSALVAEWAATNPQAGLAYLLEKDNSVAGQLIREWLRIDPQAAINALLAGGDKARGSLRGVLSDIARLAPARLAEVLTALPKSESRWDTTAQDAFAIFAQKDPEAARAAAEAVSGPLRGQALAGVAKAWAEKDGPAALAWAQAIPVGEARDAALKAALIGWAKTDPGAALDKIDLVPPGGEEMYYASDVGAQVLREAAKRDWDGTIRWLREHPGKLGRSSMDGMQDVLSQRLNTDPTGTLRVLAQSGVPGLDGAFANSLLNDGYAQRDMIWNWLDQQPPSDFTRSARSALLNAVGWKEPDVALEFLEKLPDTADNRLLLENGTRSLLNGGSQMNRFEDLLKKASAKVRPLLLEAGFQYGLQQGVTNPAQWIERLDELPTDRRGNAISGLARGWATLDPQAALGWARGLPDEALRTEALQNAVNGWANTDIYEVSQWANSLPAGIERDIAAANIVSALGNTQPESAWTWALSVTDPTQRNSALQVAYMSLHKKDAAVAQQMLQSASLSPQEVELLRGRVGK
jgi:hypothetical protein